MNIVCLLAVTFFTSLWGEVSFEEQRVERTLQERFHIDQEQVQTIMGHFYTVKFHSDYNKMLAHFCELAASVSPTFLDTTDWNADLDAVISDEERHQLLFENEYVRVVYLSCEPGDTTSPHSHLYPNIVVNFSTMPFLVTDESGEEFISPSEIGVVEAGGPVFLHKLKNVGDQTYTGLSFEIKKL